MSTSGWRDFGFSAKAAIRRVSFRTDASILNRLRTSGYCLRLTVRAWLLEGPRYRLPRCDCPGGALRTRREVHAALVPMLAVLRAAHVIAQPPVPAGPIADEIHGSTPT